MARQSEARRSKTSRRASVCGLLLTLLLTTAQAGWAQGNRRQPPAVSGKALDQQAEKIINDYLGGLADLATKYEDSGNRDKALEMLRSILKIKPDADVVKSRIKSLEEQVFNDNVFTVDLDPSAGWVMAGVLVQKDKPVRIEAEGTFRVTLNDTLTPAGYPSHDLSRDVVEGVAVGALMALVAKAESGGSGRRGAPPREKDAPKPVAIGAQTEFKPPESGALYLKINLPESARATGKIKVKITGNMLPVR